MHVKQTKINWQYQTDIKHWIKHSFLPVLLLLSVLCLPNPWKLIPVKNSPTITVQLVESKAPAVKPPQSTPIKQVKTQPITNSASHSPSQINPQPSQKRTQTEVQPQQPTKDIKQIQAGDVLLMVKNRKSMVLTEEFQARSDSKQNFYIPEQQIHNWMANIPYLDESIDQPQLQMKFYAEGIEGHIEKFFDKITVSKTFTTQYGTKIHCALIGVIAACGWK